MTGTNYSSSCHVHKCTANFFYDIILDTFPNTIYPEKYLKENITKTKWSYSQFCISEKWICETRLAKHQALVTEAISADIVTTFMY